MPHDIVVFQNAVLGNVFGDFLNPECQKPLILLHSQILSQNKAKMGVPKMLLGKRENVFLGEFTQNILFLGTTILGKMIHFWEKSQQNTGGAYA